jgi:hypothetical protein
VNNIIQQICENYISEVLDFFDTGAIRTLDEMETELKEKTNCYLRNMMKIYLEGLDEAIAEDKTGRKKKGYVVEQKAVKREIYTQFGSLGFKRRYYKNKLTGGYSYLLDKVVGTSHSGIDSYGIRGTVFRTSAALHTTVFIFNLCFLFIHAENSMRTNLRASSAANTFFNRQAECCDIF